VSNSFAELLEAQHLLGEIINYFEEIEEQLAKQSGFPVKLLQKAKAFQAFAAVSEAVEECEEARRRSNGNHGRASHDRLGATFPRCDLTKVTPEGCSRLVEPNSEAFPEGQTGET
jgi:hypothetical protein